MTTTRVPQEERSRVMRARLLEATVELLVERGFSGTSTTLVSERAGVSRGAQLHHFPTKNDLVVAAVEHLTQVRGAELAAAAAAVPTPRSTRAVLDLLGDPVRRRELGKEALDMSHAYSWPRAQAAFAAVIGEAAGRRRTLRLRRAKALASTGQR